MVVRSGEIGGRTERRRRSRRRRRRKCGQDVIHKRMINK